MKKNNKIAFGCLGGIVIFLLFAYVGAWLIAPGSYARAETYEFNIPEDSLLTIIYEVKNENPELDLPRTVNIPNGQDFDLEDGRRDEKDYWYSVYFYYPDKNEILHTWTRPKTKNSTTFAFVGINSGLTLGNWRTVNESFWWWKNQPDKKEFEERILKKIKEKTKAHN
ncbi:hypothetical protein [Echinicola salinicaeni]|uniref:hypothetical protein n=1 Tax=Echinicola salinicaeni TaxID=2762757 RepID=UPI00164777A4|nr:hypothetical protein [Echinicola salinicaeni]